MIAKVKVAQKQLGLTEDDYRAVLLRVVGRTSAAHCSEAELALVLDEFKRQGFKPLPPKGPAGGRRGAADHPVARKARALWISLHQLGAIDNPSEAALEAFARRQLKSEQLQWANQTQGYKLIEALKAIAARHGWDTDVAGLRADTAVKILKRRLCDAILTKLRASDFAAEAWTLEVAAERLLGHAGYGPAAFWSSEQLERVAQGFAAKLKARP